METARFQAIRSIRSGAFRSFEGKQLSCDGYFNKQVAAGGNILGQVNKLVAPSLSWRLFRGIVKPIASLGGQALVQGLESVLDPTSSGRGGGNRNFYHRGHRDAEIGRERMRRG